MNKTSRTCMVSKRTTSFRPFFLGFNILSMKTVTEIINLLFYVVFLNCIDVYKAKWLNSESLHPFLQAKVDERVLTNAGSSFLIYHVVSLKSLLSSCVTTREFHQKHNFLLFFHPIRKNRSKRIERT